MARLHSYYRLCPLIDQKSLFGVTADKSKGCVIATLGKNIVNKYRLSDQKQIGGWSSKHHLSSPVIYDANLDKYIGVFDENAVKFWDDNTVNLDKLKKHKFQCAIWQILHGKASANIIIFKNGSCVSLDYALNFPKSMDSKSVLLEDEILLDCTLIKSRGKDVLCYLTKTNELFDIVICPLQADVFTIIHKKIKRFSCEGNENGKFYVSGYTLSTLSENRVAYILWNDGYLDKFDLINLEWSRIGSVPWISASSTVSISSMDEKHIALYGADLSQEGAILVVYNVSLGIGSCRHPLKMYCVGARLWCLEEKLVLEAVNHLGVLPYALEAERSLATLIGSHSVNEYDRFKVVDWGEGVAKMNINKDWRELAERGVSEHEICLQYFPSLLDQKDNKKLLLALGQFRDVPESILVLLLKYIINHVDVDFECINDKEWKAACESNTIGISLLDTILSLSFNESKLIPHLQNKLSKSDILFFTYYMHYLLHNESHDIDHNFESKLIKWCTVLIDAFYQQFLLLKDQQVITVLSSLRDTVNNMIDDLLDIENIIPVIKRISKGKANKTAVNNSIDYCIEAIKLY